MSSLMYDYMTDYVQIHSDALPFDNSREIWNKSTWRIFIEDVKIGWNAIY